MLNNLKTVKMRIADWVTTLLSAYESQIQPHNEVQISEALRAVARSHEDMPAEDFKGYFSEWAAFLFSGRLQMDSVWGTFFAPMMTATGNDGAKILSPDIADLDVEVVNHWETSDFGDSWRGTTGPCYSSSVSASSAASAGSCLAESLADPPRMITSRHHSPSVRPLACAAVSSCAYSSSLTLKPMDFLRSGGFTMSRLPLSPSPPRLAATLKNQQVRLRELRGCWTATCWRDFSLAALLSTGSRTLTESCSAAPFQG